MTQSTPTSWGFSLFCDDIRGELGGKFSVMGLYQAEMVFPSTVEFPTLYTKFCILIKYYEAPGIFHDDIIVRIFSPGDAKDAPSVIMPFPKSVRTDAVVPSNQLEDDQERVFSFTYPIILSPFYIKHEGSVKVRVSVGDTITKLGSLAIRKVRPNENIEMPVFPSPPPTLPPAPAE